MFGTTSQTRELPPLSRIVPDTPGAGALDETLSPTFRLGPAEKGCQAKTKETNSRILRWAPSYGMFLVEKCEMNRSVLAWLVYKTRRARSAQLHLGSPGGATFRAASAQETLPPKHSLFTQKDLFCMFTVVFLSSVRANKKIKDSYE